jgi:hypothetical protein
MPVLLFRCLSFTSPSEIGGMDQIPSHSKVLFFHPLCFDAITYFIIAAIVLFFFFIFTLPFLQIFLIYHFIFFLIKQEVHHGDAK